MRKIFGLILLSPVLAADIVNLKCENYLSYDLSANKSSPASDVFSITIDSDAKQATTKDGTFGYTEKGNQIRWEAIYHRKIGDSVAMAERILLDRFTGELENHFLTWKFEDGIQAEDLPKIPDIMNYELGLIYYANCEKTESLF